MKKLNKKGSIILLVTVILYVIVLLAVSFTTASVNEYNNARRFYHSSAAFWLAEAGANMYMQNPLILDSLEPKEFSYGRGVIRLTIDDSKPAVRYVISKGIYGKLERSVRIAYPAHIPDAYKNALSTSGNVSINGGKVSALVNGLTRLAGEITGTSTNADVLFEDAGEAVDKDLTTLTPIKGNTFKDFTAGNQEAIAAYPANEVLYVKDANITLSPEQTKGKKIIYVESNESSGHVIINGNGLVSAGQSLTVIATGKVTFNQSGNQAANSQLNVISWGGYEESVNAPSIHRGLVYTHGSAVFDNTKDSSVTSGGIIAEGGIVMGDIWSTKVFNYADMTVNGQYPPGFESLRGGSTEGVALKPSAWRELN